MMKKIFFAVMVFVSFGIGVAAFLVLEGWPRFVMGGYAVMVGVVFWIGLQAEREWVFREDAKGGIKEPEEVILEIIRQKGRARRRDFMPHLDVSKSTLVRMLDKMEEDGVIVQVGERKASYYELPRQ